MKLNFRKLGEGQPLLVLHGLFGSSDNWQTLAKKWAKKYQVYLIDQRNHGHSPHSEEMNYDVMSEDLAELIASENLRDIVLMGHSMGGKTALTFAQSHGFLIEKLIIVDMGLKAYPPHHDTIFKGLFHVNAPQVSSRGEAESKLREFVQDDSTVQFLLKNLYWEEQGKLNWRFNLPVLHENIESILSGLSDQPIDSHTLMIVGGKSGYVPASDFDSIHAQIPHLKMEVIPQAGHWIHAEAPQEFSRIVEAFIDNGF